MNISTDYSRISAEQSLTLLSSSLSGLTNEEADKRLRQYGYNELPKEKKYTALIMFFNQFIDPLILLLIFAGILSLFLHEFIESIAIFTIVFLNAILGFFQEYRAEKVIKALEKISAPFARVLRNGEKQNIPARDLVPGDILLLESGDIVPADSRLLEVSSLVCQRIHCVSVPAA